MGCSIDYDLSNAFKFEGTGSKPVFVSLTKSDTANGSRHFRTESLR